MPEALRQTVNTAFTRVYRAVAFDIDGTLTPPGETAVSRDAAVAIGDLLRRGVHVILVTGRGAGSTRDAARYIKEEARLSDWYARRLSCIVLNGVALLTTPSEQPHRFLERKELLVEPLSCLDTLHNAIASACHNHAAIQVEKKEASVRIVINDPTTLAEIEQVVADVVNTFLSDAPKLVASRGLYGQVPSIAVAATDKQAALGHAADRLGLWPEHILRIGDQGDEGGNDFDFLNSPAGFSVGTLSSRVTGCLPVLDDSLAVILRAAEATQLLMRRLNLFAPLSWNPEFARQHEAILYQFERLALRRARQEAETVTQRLRVRLRYLIGQETDIAPTSALQLNDIFDSYSGAVVFSDWEFGAVATHPAAALFKSPTAQFAGHKDDPRLAWSIYSDTAVLLRGPNYYFSLSRRLTAGFSVAYAEMVKVLISRIRLGLEGLAGSEPSLALFKILLAYLDNVRNVLISALYAAYLTDGVRGSGFKSYQLQRVLVRHTHLHLRILLDPDLTWEYALREYHSLISELALTLPGDLAIVLRAASEVDKPARVLRKWRECDHFLKNVAAIQVGLQEFMQHSDFGGDKGVTACSIVYGGTELPAIAQSIGEARGVRVDGALVALSVYGNKPDGEIVRRGDVQYVEQFLLRPERVRLLGNEPTGIRETRFILLDDNMTTGTTLQLGRDLIVKNGGDVLGAIVICFPSANRQVQMAMMNHGLPDPDQLFGFVRGLVSPSPYTRLLYPKDGKNPYLDQTGQFDKARARIERYLLKNGTGPQQFRGDG